MILYPYSNASQSAKALKDALGIKMIKKEGSKFKGGKHKTVINWGNSRSTQEIDLCNVLNHPSVVSYCVDKLKFCNAMEPYVPPFRTTREDAELLLKHSQSPIVARTVLNGHSGEGIVIINSIDEMVDAPLYTQYIPKEQEYRVHVFLGEAFFVQRKARKKDVPDDQVNWKVRNLAGGFIYQHNYLAVPESVVLMAKEVVARLGLDFGAVDIIYHRKDISPYVLEINTAPGLTGTTLQKYVEQFESYHHNV